MVPTSSNNLLKHSLCELDDSFGAVVQGQTVVVVDINNGQVVAQPALNELLPSALCTAATTKRFGLMAVINKWPK